ncbi:MAG: PAS domain S-box protein, partial [Lentisphaeria bacterium]|nr:PAS domain S-box protein [Lentisphaeria bacterium]
VDEQGNTFAHTGLQRDITERKRTEQALTAEKEFTEAALNAQTDTFFVFEPSTGRAVRWNETFSRVSGYSDQEIRSMKAPGSYYSEEDLSKAAAVVEQVIKTGIGTVVLEFITKDGRRITTEYTVAVIRDIEEDPEYIIAIGRDITERKRAEEEKKRLEAQLRQSQKMEAVGQLAGGVAHDFNNLMQAVIGYAQRLMASSPPPTGDTRHYVECIRDSALRASDLTDLLLAFCRKNEQPPSITMLEPVLQEAARMLRASLPATVELTVDLHPLSTPVLVSSVQLVEVIITLALKVLRGFGTESGRLYITLDEIEVKDDLPTHVLDKLHHGRYALIHIGDSSSVIDALFPESPRDLSNERTQRPSASDFDVIQNILLELGGALTMRSPLHKGRLYTLYLPLASDAETPTTPRATGWDEPRRSETQGHGEHILFVDDEQMLAELGKLVGEEHSYNVTTHTVSIEALEAFAADPEKYDLVITDQTMPGMTGFDLAQKMLAIRPDLPIVLTTGYSAIIDEARAMSIGIKAYLMKPITPETLAETIHGLLEG